MLQLLDQLNDFQREAVCASDSTVLVLAGAGSGKTRVLVHRIAWLVHSQTISPHSILAVTFTNKAANEMRLRVEKLLNMSAGSLWIGTFHGIAHRLLRKHWQDANLPQTFQILDSDDQHRIVKRIIQELGIETKELQPKHAQWFINARKDEGQRPENIIDDRKPNTRQLIQIYSAYEQVCQRSGLVDFAELLLRAHTLWLQNPSLLEHYRQRFQCVLVDEFQDTNTIQYAWLRMLVGEQGQLFVVGDDDQSIYGWRGAKIENLHRLEKEFKNTRIIRLEQNYRSSGTILNAANSLIANNNSRLGKNLWTSLGQGELISVYAAFNEIEEARYIVENVKTWVAQGGQRQEIAVLYRSNAQSRVLEEALLQAGLAYRIYGGMRFFERAEIKDAMAYVRLIANQMDDAAFDRVVNFPARGIGGRTLDQIRQAARFNNSSLWDAAKSMLEQKQLSSRSANAVDGFLQLIENLHASCSGLRVYEIIEWALDKSQLLEFYKNDKGEKARMRVENLNELVQAASQFEQDYVSENDLLSEFISHASLESGDMQGSNADDCVQLMTLHSAKGLEFPLVIICGLEEKLFPHERSMYDLQALEEERRLCYVGMTRAMKKLVLSYAQSRRLYGNDNFKQASRFLTEIPGEYIQQLGMGGIVTKPAYRPSQRDTVQQDGVSGLRLGARVLHKKFGEGVVLQFEGDRQQARVQVQFNETGSKWLVVAVAKLQVV